MKVKYMRHLVYQILRFKQRTGYNSLILPISPGFKFLRKQKSTLTAGVIQTVDQTCLTRISSS